MRIADLKKGFTLVELSIVLVIIGLLALVTLGANDLVRATRIRSTAADLRSIDSAVNAFQLKYGELPGDIHPVRARSYNLFELTLGTPWPWYSDGFLGGDACNPESLVFWRHLSESELIPQKYGMNGAGTIDPVTGGTVGTVTDFSESFPKARFSGTYLMVQSANTSPQENAHLLGGVLELEPSYCTLNFGTMTPMNSYLIDIKLDDGWPNRGSVKSVGNSALASVPGNCKSNAASSNDINANYNLDGASADVQACFLLMPFN